MKSLSELNWGVHFFQFQFNPTKIKTVAPFDLSLSLLLDTFKQLNILFKTIYQNKKLVNIFPLYFRFVVVDLFFIWFFTKRWSFGLSVLCTRVSVIIRTSNLSTILCTIFQLEFFFGHILNATLKPFSVTRPIHSHLLTLSSLFRNTENSHIANECLSVCVCFGDEWSGKMINISKRVKKQINQFRFTRLR